ncbi:uncharacterized protein LAESUDRAFT_721308 [Laetiporus sulphureus 93-53]|uniref:C2H2-type domain-containing protein n=1 Tax=Laetiporus sulphureus 93-53 TaxID=1314785 RepID=A0A165GW66_9APHY|nr:uncharacterized protein LAESUDRAFT_721308 [Laetiporus sulphureus 93-53]KZT10909.1 hypothetical protein LAESUDRAFT_721308 [Laetiporus sulphureus 93-53]
MLCQSVRQSKDPPAPHITLPIRMNPYYTSGRAVDGHDGQNITPNIDPRYAYQDPSLHYSTQPSHTGQVYQAQTLAYNQHPQSAQSGAYHTMHRSQGIGGDVVAQQVAHGTTYGASGQTLRGIPFSSAYPASQGNYGSNPPPSHSFAGQAYSQVTPAQSYSPPQPSSSQGARYIPTPAQTMQSYQSLPRGSANNSIVIPPPSSPSPGVERYPCDMCDRTFSRPHDRKRHFESQHMQTSHACKYCRKEFSRADSLKRHLDNGCDKMPSL